MTDTTNEGAAGQDAAPTPDTTDPLTGQLARALRQLDGDPIDETGYYREAFASFRGPGSGLRVAAIIGAVLLSAGLIYCLVAMFGTDDSATLIRLGVFALLLGQAQIALKLWFNMQLNRRAVTSEIRRLGLGLSQP